MAKALLMRPNVAALRMWGSYAVKSNAPALTYLQGINRRHHQLNPRIVLSNKLVSRVGHESAATSVGRRRPFCVRATTDSNPMGSIDSPLMESMEKKEWK